MTVNVRPSWIELEVEGRKSDIATGPRSREGNMYATFYVRQNGVIVKALNVNFFSNGKTVKVSIDLDHQFKDVPLHIEHIYNQ